MTENNLLDETRSACLCDQGLPEYLAAVAVSPDGTEHLVLVERDSLGDDDVVYDSNCRNARHEGLGKLPREFRDAVWGDVLRCGRPTATGKPCRARVAEPGGVCGMHRNERARR
jgi:hypothetical protein